MTGEKMGGCSELAGVSRPHPAHLSVRKGLVQENQGAVDRADLPAAPPPCRHATPCLFGCCYFKPRPRDAHYKGLEMAGLCEEALGHAQKAVIRDGRSLGERLPATVNNS